MRAEKFANFFGFNFASCKRFEKFCVDLMSRMSLKTAKMEIFGHKLKVLTGFSTQNAILKISRGSNFTSQQSHTFLRVLISRKCQKFAKTRNLISWKLIRLKYLNQLPPPTPPSLKLIWKKYCTMKRNMKNNVYYSISLILCSSSGLPKWYIMTLSVK